MSRVIKFRAWDNVKNEMFYTGEEDLIVFMFSSSGIIADEIIPDDSVEGFHAERLEHLQYMQFTGLLDKNGVEIYEGDILRVWQEDEYIPYRDSGGGLIDYDREKGFSQIGKIGFTGCSFDYSTVKTLDGKEEKIHAPIDWINNYEVIGNIHQHPHLLEGS